jgi:hypothetical protein
MTDGGITGIDAMQISMTYGAPRVGRSKVCDILRASFAILYNALDLGPT